VRVEFEKGEPFRLSIIIDKLSARNTYSKFLATDVHNHLLWGCYCVIDEQMQEGPFLNIGHQLYQDNRE
jgi:hypothetical protein